MTDWRKIEEQVVAYSSVVSFLKSLPIDEIRQFFPLTKGDNTKKVLALKQKLRQLSTDEIILYLSRSYWQDVVLAKSAGPVDLIQIPLCEYNKEKKEFLVFEHEVYSEEKIEREINLAKEIVSEIEKYIKKAKKIDIYEVRRALTEEIKRMWL